MDALPRPARRVRYPMRLDDVSMPPVLIVVSGPPAAGKSTLAQRLGEDLGWPVVAKDAIKEALAGDGGAASVQESRDLGRAAFAETFEQAADVLLQSRPCVMEGNFAPQFADTAISGVLQRTGAQGIQVHCVCEPAVLMTRYLDRAQSGVRHAVHFDLDVIDDLRNALHAGLYGPVDVHPIITYDTTVSADGYRLLLRQVRHLLAISRPEL